MIIAVGRNHETNRSTLYIGLQAENMVRLMNDEPIQKRLDGSAFEGMQVDGLESWDLVIMGPEDTVRFVAAHRPDRLGDIGV